MHTGDDAAARLLARQCNELAAEMIRDRPDRYAGFACLPLPDVDGALAELAYALDGLQLDGVLLFSNVRGVYLGDPRFAPLFDELQRRAAVAFVHPPGVTRCCACCATSWESTASSSAPTSLTCAAT